MRWALVLGLAACGFRPSAGEGELVPDAPATADAPADMQVSTFTPACGSNAAYQPRPNDPLGHTYFATANQPMFDDAVDACRADGAYLVRVADAAEEAYVATFSGNFGAWIGASDQETEGTFRNIASDNSVVAYSSFQEPEPNNAGGHEDCVVINGNHAWNDTQCGDTIHRAVCECDPQYIAPSIPICRTMTATKTIQSRMYFVHTTATTWVDARDQCASIGAYLMVPSDDEENGYIQNGGDLNTSGDAWVGASQTGAAWTWVDQSPYAYQRWNTNPPATTNECAVVRSNSKWDPDDCAATHRFVCECPP